MKIAWATKFSSNSIFGEFCLHIIKSLEHTYEVKMLFNVTISPLSQLTMIFNNSAWQIYFSHNKDFDILISSINYENQSYKENHLPDITECTSQLLAFFEKLFSIIPILMLVKNSGNILAEMNAASLPYLIDRLAHEIHNFNLTKENENAL